MCQSCNNQETDVATVFLKRSVKYSWDLSLMAKTFISWIIYSQLVRALNTDHKHLHTNTNAVTYIVIIIIIVSEVLKNMLLHGNRVWCPRGCGYNPVQHFFNESHWKIETAQDMSCAVLSHGNCCVPLKLHYKHCFHAPALQWRSHFFKRIRDDSIWTNFFKEWCYV